MIRTVAERREGLRVRFGRAWFPRDCTFAAGGEIFVSLTMVGLSLLTSAAVLCVVGRVGPGT